MKRLLAILTVTASLMGISLAASAASPALQLAPAQPASNAAQPVITVYKIAGGHEIAHIHLVTSASNASAASAAVTAASTDTGGTLPVNANQYALADAWVEYNGGFCDFVASGSYTTTRVPAHGQLAFSTASFVMDNGSCAGRTYPFAVVSYNWTDSATSGTDPFSLTWSTGDDSRNLSYSPYIAPKQQGKSSGSPDSPDAPPGSCKCGDPIDIGSGNMYETVTDYETKGINSLSFIRYYNSRGPSATYATSLGQRWRHNYDRYLNIISSTSVMVERGDGRVIPFTQTAGVWKTDSDTQMTLSQSGANWTLKDRNDTVETYTPLAGGKGLLASIKYRNGYTQSLGYDTGNKLTTVTDSFGRSLSFAYQNNLIFTVTNPRGIATNYYYNSSGVIPNVNDRLSEVYYAYDAKLNGSRVGQFAYFYEDRNNPFLMTSVDSGINDGYAAWTYDTVGRATSSFLPYIYAGFDVSNKPTRKITVSYNDTTGSRTVTNTNGQQEVYKFTTLQNIPKITEIDRIATSTVPAAQKYFTYDSNGYLASETDWNGNKTLYSNDIHGHPTSITEAAGTSLARATSIAYDVTWIHQPKTITAPRETTSFTYDSSGNLSSRTHADTSGGATNGQTRSWQYQYDGFGHITKITDPLGAVTVFTYNSATNNLAKISDALGHSATVSSYNASGYPLSVTDQNGIVTNFTYNDKDHLLSATVKAAQGNLVTQFDWYGDVLSTVTNPAGSAHSLFYYNSKVLTEIVEYYQAILYTLDDGGNIIRKDITDNTTAETVNRTQRFGYDSLGRVLMRSGSNAGVTASHYTYDANGNALTAIDPLGSMTAYAYDALGRPVKQTDANGGVTSYLYDTQDNVVKVTDARGLITAYGYDGFAQRVSESSPDSGTTVYTLDKIGNRVKETDARGVVTTRTFDLLGRILSETYPSGTSTLYTWDSASGGSFQAGRLAKVSDESGSALYSYDSAGNLASQTQIIAGSSYVTAYRYNGDGYLTAITLPSGHIASFTRDLSNRVTALAYQSQAGGAASSLAGSVTYKPFGPVTGLTFGNGLTQTSSFDLDYQPTSIKTINGSSYIQNLAMGFDAASDITGITDNVDASRSQGFMYDKLYRLTKATGQYGTLQYTYDLDGNRISKLEGGVTKNYLYPAASNRVASMTQGGSTVRSFSYDAAGNTTYDSYTGNFTYSPRGRLSQAANPSGATGTYKYNAFGQRASRVYQAGVNTIPFNSIYDLNGNLIAEYNGGTLVREYYYLNNIPIAQLEQAAGQFYYIHTDHLGTPQKLTNAAKAVVWDRIAKPFGEDVSITGSLTHKLRFPGQHNDAETGLDYNGFRHYDPTLGRYLQADPIGLEGGINRYAYVQGNPLSSADPLGLGPWDKTYGFSKEFWNWLHRTENGKLIKDLKDPKTGQVPKDVAQDYHDIWKDENGFLDPDLLLPLGLSVLLDGSGLGCGEGEECEGHKKTQDPQICNPK